MNMSQNVRFVAKVIEACPDEPPGRSIADLLAGGLTVHGWAPSSVDIWRDAGWTIQCRRGSADIQIALAGSGDQGWMLQVAPTVVPGIFARLRKKTSSASPINVHAVAVAVSKILSSDDRFSQFMWRWDGPPDRKHSTTEPEGPANQAL